MNNNEKFKETIAKVKQLRESYETDLSEQIATSLNSKNRGILEEKKFILEELNFPERKTFFTFYSAKYGYYDQMKQNRKGRLRAVPLCFFVTLYEQDLKAVFPKEEIQIPYTLRGFWKMKQAIQLMEEFTHLQNQCQEIILWESRRLKKEGRAKATEYSKILDEFVSIRTSSSGWKAVISYKDFQFTMNKKNVKLDAVPLCKLLTLYYVNVLKLINHYMVEYASKPEQEKLQKIEDDFSNFMKKYFA